MTEALLCHRCGYDLRVQPADGVCPECETPVAASQEAAAVPRRPAWRDSDPRWRRRMLAGCWVLVLVPLMELLNRTGLADHIVLPSPISLEFQGANWPLSQTLAATFYFVPWIVSIGLVLLFAKEQGRRRHRLDWTRRWGVFGSYVVFVLGVASYLLLVGLVLVGITALLFSLPLENQPQLTPMFSRLASASCGTGRTRRMSAMRCRVPSRLP